jgi:hypothetical protein
MNSSEYLGPKKKGFRQMPNQFRIVQCQICGGETIKLRRICCLNFTLRAIRVEEIFYGF